MSARHTRPVKLDPYGLRVGTAFVPSMGYVGSVMPAGRHRREAPRNGQVRWLDDGWEPDFYATTSAGPYRPVTSP